jgi:ATP-dependent helicase/nuclease subunit A
MMELTRSQRGAIEHRGSNLLVTASAGAGKTEVLARRCVSLVADEDAPCNIDELLIVTFTRAAAAELRVRVGRMLRAAARETPAGARRRHLLRQALLVDVADIGTIDAWCGQVLRANFATAGIDVDFGVLDTDAAVVLRRQVLDDLLRWVHQDGDPLAVDARAWLRRHTSPQDEFLRGLINTLNRYRENLVDPEAWLAAQREALASDDTAAVLARALRTECTFQREQVERLRGAQRDEPAVAAALTEYGELLTTAIEALADPGAIAATVEAIKSWKIKRAAARGAGEPALVKEVRERWLKARLQKRWPPDAVADMLAHAALTAERLTTLLDLEARYQQMLLRAKHGMARYEFGDVLRMTLDLLATPDGGAGRRPTPIAERLQQRYAHILVDEYQDTSPVQVEILQRVTRTARGATNRFMVGDVKQSIYGFRQAEPELFVALREAFVRGAAEGAVQPLPDNFRTHGGLLQTLNEVFARLFCRVLGGTEYGAAERLQAGRSEPAGGNATLDGQPRLAVHVLEAESRRGGEDDAGDDEDDVLVERIEREAQVAVERIRALLDEGAQIPVRQPDGSVALRPLRRSDVAILLRSAAQNAGRVAHVLRASGIACATSGRETLLDALEVQDVCNALRLIVNRRQDVPLAAYLRGPLVGLSAAELLEIRQAAPAAVDFWDACAHVCDARPREALAARLDAAITQLDRWDHVAAQADVAGLIRCILRESSLETFAAAQPGGQQRVALLRSLMQVAREFAGRDGGGVADFVTHLEALTEAALDPGAVAVGEEDVVRIMTIHAAKGLEFPVVFLLGAGQAFNRISQAAALQCDAASGLGLRTPDAVVRTNLVSARHHVGRYRVAERELSEELRLLYVATTRARERLVVVGHTTPGYWEALQDSYGGLATLPLVARLSVSTRLEWLLMALATMPAGLRSRVDVAVQPAQGVTPSTPQPSTATPDGALDDADAAWVARGLDLVQAEVGSVWSDFPAVLSVSAAKRAVGQLDDEDAAVAVGVEAAALRRPQLSGKVEPDGRAIGSATHRFLELADLTALTSAAAVEAQRDTLVTQGRLTAAEAALVDVPGVAWFGADAAGALWRAHGETALRELPFVYALPVADGAERTILRGIVDCLVPTPAGWVIVDYKTDQPRDAQDWQHRVRGYTAQLQLYARAVGAIFAEPIAAAKLVFLRGRRVIDVPLPGDVDALVAALRRGSGAGAPAVWA